MTGNRNAWRAPLAGLASVAMLATMGVAAGTANAVSAGKVTLDPQGGVVEKPQYIDGGQGDGSADGKLSALYSANAFKPTKANYTFTGWYTADGHQAVGPDTVVAPNATLYAHWTANAVKNVVRFTNSASNDAFVASNYSGKASFVTVDGNSVEVVLANGDNPADWQTPSLNAAKYNGWVRTDGSGAADPTTVTTDGQRPVELAPNAVSNAVFYKFNAAVTDVQWSTGQSATEIAVPAGSAAPTVYYTDAASKAMKATAWKVAGANNAVDPSTVAAGTTLNVAATEPVYKATVKFTDSENFTEVKDSQTVYLEGDEFDYVDTEAFEGLESIDGYIFDGWYKENDLTQAVSKLTNKKLFGAKGSAAVVYGSFTKADATVEVTFDLHYDGAPAPTTATVTKGERLGDALPTPTRDGFVFAGWQTASGNPVTKDTKANASDLGVKNGKATVYATWRSASYAELRELLAIQNQNPKIYVINSYQAFDKARDAVAKQINKDYGAGFVTENAATGAWTVAKSLNKISEKDIEAYTATLREAASKLEILPDLSAAYTDVNALTPHYTDIIKLTKRGVVKGYADKTFRPMDGLNRQDFAAYLYRLAGEPEFDPAKATKTFSDVNASTPHYKAILWAASNGIVNGYPDGSFKGMDLINRQDAAAMLYRLAGSPTYTVNFGAFVDVDSSTPHYKAILWAAKAGVVNGYANGTFNGYSTIVRQDAAAFLNRMLDKDYVAKYLK